MAKHRRYPSSHKTGKVCEFCQKAGSEKNPLVLRRTIYGYSHQGMAHKNCKSAS